MAEANEVEPVLAVQALVARAHVDRGVGGPAARVVVQVAVVDVHVDAPKLVHDLREALEVDGDDVVDGDVRQVLDRLQGSLRAAVRVGLVDPAAERPGSPAPRDVDYQVARERQHRDDLLVRVGPDEHDGVGARAAAGVHSVRAPVVAEDERDGGLVRLRHVQDLLCLLHLAGVRAHRRDALVDEEPGTPRESPCRNEEDDDRPQEDLADDAEGPPAPGAVARDRRQGRDGKRSVPVPVNPSRASLERRSHTKSRRAATRGE